MLDKTNGVVSGNDCIVWLNGEILDDLKQFEWKVTLDFADVNYLNDPRTYKKYQGFSGEATLTFNKTRSRGATLLKDAIKSGTMPDIKIVTKLENKSTGKAERAVFTGITFNEFGASSEAKTVGEESLPFSFSDIDFPELM
ncbi:phage tail tube protein [Brevibacillus agri]|uniref:phage tail tube protein n=1 Tax=Brevibacillus agri TaxID=51101 RepID=UPI0025B646F3|nr:phage tail tube protein [Brevibacillus agri]MDN4093575.1 phage tail tube protein [Brevibacillus agri]